jgi:phosphotransacetylase
MKKFIKYVKKIAQKDPKRVAFPEGFEERILRATERILKDKTAIPVLIGDPKEIKKNAKDLGLKIDFEKVEIHNPMNDPKKEEYAKAFYELRKHKGITMEEALKTMEKINYFGTMMVQMGDADGLISGTTYSTADTVRPALQIIKTQEKFHKVSGVFFMILEKRLLLFADAAITINPNSHDLAAIAIDTAETAKQFD